MLSDLHIQPVICNFAVLFWLPVAVQVVNGLQSRPSHGLGGSFLRGHRCYLYLRDSWAGCTALTRGVKLTREVPPRKGYTSFRCTCIQFARYIQ